MMKKTIVISLFLSLTGLTLPSKIMAIPQNLMPQKIDNSPSKSDEYKKALCSQLYGGIYSKEKGCCGDQTCSWVYTDLKDFFEKQSTRNMGTKWYQTIAASELSSVINPQNVNAPISSKKTSHTDLLTEDIRGIWTGMGKLHQKKPAEQDAMSATKQAFNARIYPLYSVNNNRLTVKKTGDKTTDLLIHLKAVQQLIPSCIQYFKKPNNEKSADSTFAFNAVNSKGKFKPFFCDPTILDDGKTNGFKDFWSNIKALKTKINNVKNRSYTRTSQNTDWNESYTLRLKNLSAKIDELDKALRPNTSKKSQEQWKDQLNALKTQAEALIHFVQPIVLQSIYEQLSNTKHLEISNLLGRASYLPNQTKQASNTNIRNTIVKTLRDKHCSDGSFKLTSLTPVVDTPEVKLKQQNLQDLSSYLQTPDFFLYEIPFELSNQNEHSQTAFVAGVPLHFQQSPHKKVWEANWSNSFKIRARPSPQHQQPMSEIIQYRQSIYPTILDKRNEYFSLANSLLAQKSFSMGLLYELGMRRSTEYEYTYSCGSAEGKGTIGPFTPEQIDEYNATFRMTSDWQDEITNESSEVELMKEMVLLLAEQRAEQFREYSQNERIIASMALSQIQLLNGNKLSSLKTQRKQIDKNIQSYLNGQEGDVA